MDLFWMCIFLAVTSTYAFLGEKCASKIFLKDAVVYEDREECNFVTQEVCMDRVLTTYEARNSTHCETGHEKVCKLRLELKKVVEKSEICDGIEGPCKEKLVQTAFKSPVETCHLKPVEKCEPVVELVPGLKEVRECQEKPVQVCRSHMANVHVEKRPAVKRYCSELAEQPGKGVHPLLISPDGTLDPSETLNLPRLPQDIIHSFAYTFGASYRNKILLCSEAWSSWGACFIHDLLDIAHWRPTQPLPGADRQDYDVYRGVAQVNDALYVFGGLSRDHYVQETDSFLFNFTTETWDYCAPLPTPRRNMGAIALNDNKILIAGGVDINVYYSGQPTDHVLIYDTRTDSYEQGQNLPSVNGKPSLGLLPGGLVLLIGGLSNQDGSWVPKSDFYIYDPSLGIRTVAGNYPLNGAHFSILTIGNSVVVAGGGPEGKSCFKLNVTPSGWSWEALEDIKKPYFGGASFVLREAAECSAGWLAYPESEKCVKWFAEPLEFDEASQRCQAMGQNGHLVSIHSEAQHRFLVDVVLESNYPGSVSEAWIGLQNRNADKTFQWTDGSAVDFLRLQTAHSAGPLHDEHCAYLFKEFGIDYDWHDVSCTAHRVSYICQRSMEI